MKILIIDDSPFSRTIIEQALSPLNIECIQAECGATAWKILQSDQSIKLITLDMVLPDTDGLTFLKRCRSLPNIRQLDFVLITSKKSDDIRVSAFEYGAANFLTKPFKPLSLINVCKRLLFKNNQFSDCQILIVDDSSTTRELIAKSLAFFGVKTIEVSSAIEAIKLFRLGEKIDLLITDMRMPKMTGSELSYKVRQMPNYSTIPIIMLSSNTCIESTLNCFKSGISDYLSKPFISEELIARVRVHLSSYLQSLEAQETLQELEDLNRIKDEILAVCSHDIRSPLTSILGNTELLLEQSVPEAKEFLEDIKDSGQTVLSLVNKLLETGKNNSQKEKYFLILKSQNILMKVIRQLNAKATLKDLKIETSLIDAEIKGDESDLKRIFSNLLSNALKFTPEHGRIYISSKKSNQNLIIKIQDSGIGIPSEMIPQLFEKYTQSSIEGTSGEASTGLGMSIVQDLVQKHKGSIEVISEVGVGSIFSVSLPLSQQDRRNSISFDLSQSRILIADDDLCNLRLLEKVLSKSDIKQITSVQNGEALVEAYKESMEDQPYQIIITDIEMPKLNGEQAIEIIRGLHNSKEPLYIIALSGHKEVYFKNGLFDEVLTKPIIPPQLRSCLANLNSSTTPPTSSQ
jgi:two-component system, sensor histidine kinase and response regulator